MTHVHTPKCRDFLGTLSEFLDGALQEELCRELEEHLSECENCRVVVDTLKKTIYLYKTTSSSSEIPMDVRERLFKRLNLEAFVKRS
jgi:anti-sigma factor (TIGR02949 family)